MTYAIAAFYRFVSLAEPEALQTELRAAFEEGELLGTILIAGEGVNGTVAGSSETIDRLLILLAEKVGLDRAEVKFSSSKEPPFGRLKIKVKREIIAFREAEVDPTRAGQYVQPAEWNALMADPEVLLLDTRNRYETEIGTFKGAVDPGINKFSDFVTYVRGEPGSGEAAQGSDVLYRRYPLREGLGLHAAGGLWRGLPPEGRYLEVPGGRAGRGQQVARGLLYLRPPDFGWA